MSLDNLTLFSAVKKRMNWVNQRQEVLAQNVANSDTPDYKARDLRPFKFNELLRRETMAINLTQTGSGHLDGQRKRTSSFTNEEVRTPYETAPGGNSVVLEEQMSKMSENKIQHKFTNELYRKHMTMLKMALGRG